MESRTGSVVSGSGCIHAIRRELYRPIPAYVADDITISTTSIVQGKRLVFEEEAVAFEEPAKRSRGEFQRKVRMMTRGFRSLVFRRRLFNPFQVRVLLGGPALAQATETAGAVTSAHAACRLGGSCDRKAILRRSPGRASGLLLAGMCRGPADGPANRPSRACRRFPSHDLRR